MNSEEYLEELSHAISMIDIDRSTLWPILLKNGIKGKLFWCLQSMYNNVKARVRNGAELS